VTNVSRRYDGVRWNTVTTPSSTDALYSVWYGGSGFAVAVGEASNAGVIYHLNGSSWSNVPTGDPKNCASSPGLPSPGLRSVWGSSASNVLAVGNSGAFRRWNTCWSTPVAQPAAASAQLFGISGSSATNVFATTLTSTVFGFNDTSWTTLPAIPSAPASLVAVWTSSANDLFAVGDAIMHYDGTKWARMTGNGQVLTAIAGTGPRNVFAVGNNSRLLHYDGISWTPIKVPTQATTFLRGVAATSRSLFVVGEGGFAQRLSFSVRPNEVNCRDTWDDDGDGNPDCADADCAGDLYCKRGGACSVIEDIKCGDTIDGTTLGRTPGRDYYTCDANAETGPEAIYRIVPAANQSATATLSAYAPNELDLVVVGAMQSTDACDPDIACAGASSTTATATEAVSLTLVKDRPQFIIVEGRNAAAGPFKLTVTCQ
jgi:hypothetical protein